MKKNLDALLLANPKAAKHKDVLKQTLDDIERLRKVGMTAKGYRLSSPYGVQPLAKPSQRQKLKMTYCS